MKILIVSATYLEIEPLLLQFKLEKKINQKLKRFSYKNHTIDVLITGIGMTSTAYWMGKTINSTAYDLALNLGLAGSFDPDIKIGDVVHVDTDQISELGAEDGDSFLSLIDINLIPDEHYLLNHGKMKNSTPINNEVINQLVNVNAITVNTTHGNDTSIEKIQQLHHPQIETMEGAAFFYACLFEGITCSQIRSISNKVEKRNKDNWQISLSVKTLCKTSLQIIDSL